MEVTIMVRVEASEPTVPIIGCNLNSMHDITRFTSRAKKAPNVRNSSRLPEMPSNLVSRKSEARELSSSIPAAAVANNRLIMLKASPIALILANIAAVSNPSGSII